MFSTYLVARRDYLGYVTAWGFWLGLLFTPVILAIFMFAPMLAQNSAPTRYFAVIESGEEFTKALDRELVSIQASAARASLDLMATAQGQDSPKLDAFDAAIEGGASVEEALEAAGGAQIPIPMTDFVRVDSPARTIEDLRPFLRGERLIQTPQGEQPLFAVLNVRSDGSAIDYWSENLQVRDLRDLARRAERKLSEERIFAEAGVSSSLLSEAEAARRPIQEQRLRTDGGEGVTTVTLEDRAPFYMSIIMAFMLWFLIFSVVNYLLMGTIEERSNKIFDSLLTSVKLPNLLAGKLLAVLALALTLMAFWGLGSTVLAMIGQDRLPEEFSSGIGAVLGAATNPALFVPAILSFVLGYLMYGSLFLALGSLCDTIQEAQTLMTPLIVMLMAPLFMLTFAISDAESPLIQTMAWVPFFTPFLLILRMPTEPPLWEVLAQLGLMAVATFAILWLAARVYRAGAVHGSGVNDIGKVFKSLLPGGDATQQKQSS
ncbi:MAG: ABC transporter permease [Pseudomonadota bacterium]